MPTDTTTPEVAPIEGAAIEPVATEPAEIEPVEGEEALGDPGKKALDAMKARVKEAEARAKVSPEELKRLREAAQEAERLKAAAEGREAEWEAERKAREDADKRYAERVLKAEIKAAAKGRLADPDDAFRFLDMSGFTPNDDGDFDAGDITSAIDALVTSKPYLAVQDGRRFQGTPDAGTRKETGPRQLTRADIAGMTPEQRADAYDKGLFRDLLGDK